MKDIVLVTADSVRHDHFDSMEFLSSFDSRVGITPAHYTRPSLAGLLSSSLVSVLQSRVAERSLAEVLAAEGYTCIGLTPTPQADAAFGFDTGFDEYETFTEGGGENPFKNRRSRVREYFGGFVPIRRLYRRLVPMEAVLSSIPPDEELVDMAIKRFNDARGPRFLWIHLMESHRPYGVGDDAIPKALDRKAGAAGDGGLFSTPAPSDEEVEVIDRTYRDALSRVDTQIERLLSELDGEPAFVFTADHGDEFGEEGYFYHQGFRRRVVDPIVEVPLVFSGFDAVENVESAHDRVSLLDVAPTLVESVGIEPPEGWHGTSLAEGGSETMITVAPWHEKVSVAVRSDLGTLIARDADVTLDSGGQRGVAKRAEASAEIEQRLRELGYVDTG
ncbi:sulfatase-like hydrolase/transferase [Haladaptatus sp. DYF46]|uniref:sulfatase-like hydrolase/transferase n=1 Tax=Haladaptatus sp. DYF46 TaxID=2886041 RepID=UPI001E5B491C|nr:sulfatase-like hydrolase/transferase [Haladaptatus sp. DYF46]